MGFQKVTPSDDIMSLREFTLWRYWTQEGVGVRYCDTIGTPKGSCAANVSHWPPHFSDPPSTDNLRASTPTLICRLAPNKSVGQKPLRSFTNETAFGCS